MKQSNRDKLIEYLGINGWKADRYGSYTKVNKPYKLKFKAISLSVYKGKFKCAATYYKDISLGVSDFTGINICSSMHGRSFTISL